MPEYLAPGVYIEEIDSGPKPIEGVSTSTAGFLGETERGPTYPRLVTSLFEFYNLYGKSDGVSENVYLPHAVEGFFINEGKRCFIGRIVGEESHFASLEIRTTFSDEAAQQDVMPSKDETEAKKSSGLEEKEETAGSKKKAHRRNQAKNAEVSTNVKKPTLTGENSAADDPLVFTIKAIGEGEWGNRIGIKIDRAGRQPESEVELKKQPEKIRQLFKLVVSYWKKKPDNPDEAPARVKEEYDNITMDSESPDFIVKQINDISNLIEVNVAKGSNGERPDKIATVTYLEKGSDGNPVTLNEYKGTQDEETGERTGLAAFETVDEISIICAPNENDIDNLSDSLVAHCENMKDRFAVLQAPQQAGRVGKLFPPLDSKYAAYYYPWVKVIDPVTNMSKLVPPGGHIVGIYARSDSQRGVHKAPANEPVRGISKLQFALTKEEQDMLNPRGVNCLRTFPGRGTRVWGARTTSSDPAWKYVNVRRLFLYLEESIEENTQWVVFEPNDQRLWARVKQSVSDFLNTEWRNGALMGNSPDEAFFVKCDRTTMTDNDIENGRLIVQIGVAPVRPAEFVVFRISQWRSGSAVGE